MAKKLTRQQASKLRDEYLIQRQELLQAKVDQLGITLYDKIFNEYLSQLEQSDGKLTMDGKNISLIKGLDAVYKNFRDKYNVPVIKQFISDAQGVVPVNETYFTSISNQSTKSATSKAIKVVNKGLGLTEKGVPVKNGFVDKFIRDETLLKKIKKQTTQALTQGKGFQQFRQELQVTIQGEKGKPLSGGLQQYYRNNAYDTLTKVDRLASETMADELGMQYFFYAGGIINNSRPLCIHCNGKIVNSAEWRNLDYEEIKPKYQPGLPNGDNGTWNPLEDLGGFGCIHRKDYIPTSLALTMRSKWLNINDILK